LPYLESDDEWAYVVSHELAHTMETSRFVPVKVVTMSLCPVRYEYKADLMGIDYMVKAGYDPIAAIIVNNKLADEHWWEWINAHPRGSKRMLAMYKYIYIKYPQYLSSPMTNDIVYKDFLRAQSKEIEKFQQQYKQRKREAI
jgi:predicted Zn-dependent protease